jgi:hypothetical protein
MPRPCIKLDAQIAASVMVDEAALLMKMEQRGHAQHRHREAQGEPRAHPRRGFKRRGTLSRSTRSATSRAVRRTDRRAYERTDRRGCARGTCSYRQGRDHERGATERSRRTASADRHDRATCRHRARAPRQRPMPRARQAQSRRAASACSSSPASRMSSRRSLRKRSTCARSPSAKPSRRRRCRSTASASARTRYFLRGEPWSQASDAERLVASMQMAMAMNPKLSIVRVRDGSLLDGDSMRLVAEMAAKN